MEPKDILLVAGLALAVVGLLVVAARRRPRRGRARAFAVGFYDYGPDGKNITVWRDDPRHGGETAAEYWDYTAASAGRVTRYIDAAEVKYVGAAGDDGRGV